MILTWLVEFFDGQGSSSKAREYIRVGELQNLVAGHLKEGAENLGEEEEGGPAELWEASGRRGGGCGRGERRRWRRVHSGE